MKRKPRSAGSSIPERLRVFRVSQWSPAGDLLAAFQAWKGARRAYAEQHRDAWPDPFAVLGPIANVRAKVFLYLHGSDSQHAASLKRYTRSPYPELDEGDTTLKW